MLKHIIPSSFVTALLVACVAVPAQAIHKHDLDLSKAQETWDRLKGSLTDKTAPVFGFADVGQVASATLGPELEL